MNVTKEILEVEDTLKSKIKNTLLFLGIKTDIQNGNIISIENTNIAYIEPHKLIINDISYLFFNGSNDVYINTLEQFISISELENHIKKHKTTMNKANWH